MLKVVKAQGQGIVSDSGRWGYQHEGVPLGGVLDAFSFAVGNWALGNTDNAACLELMGQFDFVCAKPCTVFFANRGALAMLNNKPVLCGSVLRLQEGDLLRTQPPYLGYWNMLCVQGGFDVAELMGSRSTCLAAGFGGFQGRALQVGDELHVGNIFRLSLRTGVRLAMPLALRDDAGCLPIHVLIGPEFPLLDNESQYLFNSKRFVLGLQSSRMAYCMEIERMELEQGRLVLQQAMSMRSHAVHPGLVQLPPSGRPVVLLSECQATGGYPRIASVLGTELWKFAQLASAQTVNWIVVDVAQASRLQQQHTQELGRYYHAINTSKRRFHVG